MVYELHELDRPKKFFRKHKNDKILLFRLTKKYHEILENPYRRDFIQLSSQSCPKCQRARVGDYRIVFYVHDDKKLVEIIDILPRSDDYQVY